MAEFTTELGMRTARAEGGECVIELDLDDRHMSSARRAHGGVLFTMLDTALGRAVISRLPDGRGCATIEAKINYFRPVQTGRIRAVAEVLRMTRRTAYAEASLLDAGDNVLARCSGTFFITETHEQAERERV
jgi:acyl-CoA thioesterase